MDLTADIYAALGDAEDERWEKEEKEALRQLHMFNVRQPLGMLLSSYQRFFAPQRQSFRKILQAIAIISFRYNVISNLPSNEQERLYSDIAGKISQGYYNTYQDVLKSLAELYPLDPLFQVAFSTKELRTNNSRNKKIVRYILFAIEKQRYQHAFDFESATYNIEHILPENPSPGWDYIEETQQDRLIYRLGNMTPLETSRNRELGNGEYAVKRKVYQQSDFEMTRAIALHYDSWDGQKIESRQKQLAKIASNIWRIDFEG
jgi:hypothetical protein